MNADIYQAEAKRTLIDRPERSYSDHEIMVLWNAFGLAGEASELLELYYSSALGVNAAFFIKELGDCFWYIAALCTKFNIELGDVLDRAKLAQTSALKFERTFTQLIKFVIEVGSFVDCVKKGVFHDHGIKDKTVIQFHLVSICRPLLVVCALERIKLPVVFKRNITKLKKRYPNGWDSERSINRDE